MIRVNIEHKREGYSYLYINGGPYVFKFDASQASQKEAFEGNNNGDGEPTPICDFIWYIDNPNTAVLGLREEDVVSGVEVDCTSDDDMFMLVVLSNENGEYGDPIIAQPTNEGKLHIRWNK